MFKIFGGSCFCMFEHLLKNGVRYFPNCLRLVENTWESICGINHNNLQFMF